MNQNDIDEYEEVLFDRMHCEQLIYLFQNGSDLSDIIDLNHLREIQLSGMMLTFTYHNQHLMNELLNLDKNKHTDKIIQFIDQYKG